MAGVWRQNDKGNPNKWDTCRSQKANPQTALFASPREVWRLQATSAQLQTYPQTLFIQLWHFKQMKCQRNTWKWTCYYAYKHGWALFVKGRQCLLLLSCRVDKQKHSRVHSAVFCYRELLWLSIKTSTEQSSVLFLIQCCLHTSTSIEATFC